jgi:hypothetical protein
MVGGQVIPVRRPMPGAGFLVTKNVDIEPWDPGRPMDPFEFDPAAAENTYNRYARVTVTYEAGKESEDDNNRDPLKPEEFLEHSLTTTGEFLVVRPEKVKDVDANGTQLSQQSPAHADPFIKNVPSLTHNLKWKYVVNPDWDTIIGQFGRINDRAFVLWRSVDRRFKWEAPTNTLLFTGISGSVKYLFVRNRAGIRTIMNPWQLDFQFVQRCVKDKIANAGAETDITWQMVFRPKTGWVIVKLGKALDIQLYKESDFRKLFVPQGVNYGVTG